MKIVLISSDLDSIKDAAITAFKDRHVYGLEPEQYTTFCYLQAFTAFMNSRGITVEVLFDERKFDDSIDNM